MSTIAAPGLAAAQRTTGRSTDRLRFGTNLWPSGTKIVRASAYRSTMSRHKCFISYHRADEEAVLAFKDQFDDAEDAFIFRGQSMPEDLINSSDDEYVIGEIRRRFLIVVDPLLRSNPAPALPDRVKSNVDSGYARYYWYPSSGDELAGWVDDAYAARDSSATLIQNPRARQGSDASCA